MKRIAVAFFCLPFLSLLAISQSVQTGNRKTENIVPFVVRPDIQHFAGRQNVQNIEQWVMAFRNDLIGAETIGRIADLSWKSDEGYARSLFRISLSKVTIEQRDTPIDAASKSLVMRKIFALITKHDALWAKGLIDSFSEDVKKKASAKLQIASDLLDADSTQAADLAKQSLQDDINLGFLSFLKKLRQKNEDEANQLFLRLLSRSIQTNIDAREYALFGTYVFRSPRSQTDDDQSTLMIAVGDILMPDISGNRPNVPHGLIRDYIRGAITFLNGAPGDGEQRKVKYALGYMLVPKAQEFSPDLNAELIAAMNTLAFLVPTEFTGGDAYKYLDKKPTPPEERIKDIEKTADAHTRDQLFLDMIYWAYRRNDFDIAKLVASKIDDKKLQSELETLISFGEINLFLKAKTIDLNEATQRVEKLPVSLEKCLLWLAVASLADKMKNKAVEDDTLDSARDSAKHLPDETAPFFLMYIAGQMRANANPQASTVFAEATKSFNKVVNIKDLSPEHTIKMEPVTVRFPLSVKDVNLGFQTSFQMAVKGDEENSIFRVNDINDERLKGLAFVSLVQAILSKKPTSTSSRIQEKVVSVGEGGIRKSAVKVVMPIYPSASLKNKVSGVAVAEVNYNGEGNLTDVKILESPDTGTGNSVIDAMRQWKFKPSQLEGKPINVQGKITFYFSVTERGKGEVKNPKQYQ